MQTVNLKILSVNDVTTEKGETVSVSLGLVSNPNQPTSMGGIALDITGQADEIAFYKSNAGSVLQLPIDIATVTVVKPA